MRRKVITLIKAVEPETSQPGQKLSFSEVGKGKVESLRKYLKVNRPFYEFDIALTGPEFSSLETCDQILRGNLIDKVVHWELLDNENEARLSSHEVYSRYRGYKVNYPGVYNENIKKANKNYSNRCDAIMRKVEFEMSEENILLIAKQKMVLELISWIIQKRIYNKINLDCKMKLKETGITQVVMAGNYSFFKDFDISPHLDYN